MRLPLWARLTLSSLLLTNFLVVYIAQIQRHATIVATPSNGRPSAGNVPVATNSSSRLGVGDEIAQDYKFLHVQSDTCDDKTFLIIVVTSRPRNFPHRNTIRTTWGAVARRAGSDVKLVFLLGNGGTPKIQEQIGNESKIFGDIVQQDYVDSYMNLTLKSISGLKWIKTYCKQAKYMLKTDDDMIVNVGNLKRLLANSRPSRYIMGLLNKNAQVNRQQWSKYYVPRHVYMGATYPTYVSGTSYTISTDIVPELYEVAMRMPLFFLEDVFITGICASKVKDVQLVDHWGFGQYRVALQDPCQYHRAISFHEFAPDTILRTWRKIRKLDCNNNSPTFSPSSTTRRATVAQ